MSWFKKKLIKSKSWHVSMYGSGNKRKWFFRLYKGKTKIKSLTEVTLLGIKIYKELKFKSHIEELCKKACYKLHALCRIIKYLIVDKAKHLVNTFIDSLQFCYTPLILISVVKLAVAKICKIHFEYFKLFIIR